MPTLKVCAPPRDAENYQILIESGILDQVASWIASLEITSPEAKKIILTDENLAKLGYAERVMNSWSSSEEVKLEIIPSGEKSKTIAQTQLLWESLVAHRADRQTLIIALGGGIVGDLAGFVAATFMRGIPFVQIPTTLLAQVDSSVGGKVAVNLSQVKNGIGAFHQPRGVLIDTSVLSTLTANHWESGLGEVAKYAAGLDVELFDFLLLHAAEIRARDEKVMAQVIAKCCEIKATFVERDPCETQGIRTLLNYGHTFAHAWESLSAARGENLPHGKAVAAGMRAAAKLAQRLSITDETFIAQQEKLLTQLGINVESHTPSFFATFSAEEVVAKMRLDKKNENGHLRFVLPTQIGKCRVVSDIAEKDVIAVLKSFG